MTLALLCACSGDKTTTEPIPQPQPPAAIRLVVPDTVTRSQPFFVTVTALDAQGQTHTAWSGTVALSASAGSIMPALVSVTSGVATVQATLSQHAGEVTITSSVGGVSTSRPALVMSGEPAASLRISPSSFLLPNAGVSQLLRVEVLDAGGRPTAASVSWESSNAGVVTLSSSGVATASASGSAQIVARSGSIASTPAVALVATPVSGAVLVADEQIVGGYAVVDTAVAYGPGWRYRVRLQGVAPQVGQVLIAKGEKPLGGRVVSVQAVGSITEVTLELQSLRDLLPNLSINETIPLRLESPASSPASARRAWAALYENEFEVGPFECAVKLTQPNTNPFSLLPVTREITPTFLVDIIQTPTRNRFVVRGGLTGSLSVKPTLTAALDGSLECKAQVGELQIPMPGVLVFFLAATVPVGLGFEINGGITLATMSLDLAVSSAATISMGWDCNPSCAPVFTATGTATGSVKPDFPSPASDFRVNAGISPFAWAEVEVGPPEFFPGSAGLRFKPLEAKAGLKQAFNLSSANVQSNDAAYASTFSIAPFFSGGTTKDLQQALTWLDISFPPLTYSADGSPLAESPLGSLQILPARVVGSSASQAGDTATFIVNLSRTNYLTQYAVESVQLFRRASPGAELVPAPGPCASITPTSTSQSLFTCKTDLPISMAGEQTFYAFVKPILGVALPVLLEIATDARGTVTVDTTRVFYANNFSNAAGSEWSSSTVTTSPSGERYLGDFKAPTNFRDTAEVQLTLAGLPSTHNEVTIEFDLYVIDHWDGSAPTPGGPDIFTFSAAGTLLKKTTFANDQDDPQAYPGDWPGGSNPAGTGALATNTLGYTDPLMDNYADAIYRLKFTVPHNGSTVTFKWTGSVQSMERFGIDNVRVTVR
jgi:hypothetical protein